jgi:cell division protein FtsL
MRLCVRLAALAAMLALTAMGMIYLRTDTVQAGNRLHQLYGQKRSLEKGCCRLELEIAGLKNQERLRQQAMQLLQADDTGQEPPGAPGKGGAPRPVLADRYKPSSP